MTFKLTILGSSSALPTAKRFPTAHLLNVNERFFLIDCGEGTQMQLRKFKLGFSRINQIFISHIHGDHIFGLPGLLSTMQLLGRKNKLQVFGPSDLKKHIDFFLATSGSETGFEVEFIATGHRGLKLIWEDKHVEVYAIPLKHRVPSTGFLFREKMAELNLDKEALARYRPGVELINRIKRGDDLLLPDNTIVPNRELTLPPYKRRSYAYISDTAYHPSISGHLQGVDVLYHEATFATRDENLAKQTFHSTAAQAGKLAATAGVKLLLLGHFSSRYKDLSVLETEARAEFENCQLVNDGDVFEIIRERERE